VSQTRSNKMVQLIIVTRREPLSHWRNALAIARTDQPCNVKRTHTPPSLMTQVIQERLEPALKLVFPISPRIPHGRPLQKPTIHESLKS
jgi:hypothetical protein